MAGYYVYTTQALAQASIDKINTRAAQLAQQAGRLNSDTTLAGINLGNGVIAPLVKTVTWAIPMQNLLGQWVVKVPDVFDQTINTYLIQDLTTDITATPDSTWWPQQHPHQG